MITARCLIRRSRDRRDGRRGPSSREVSPSSSRRFRLLALRRRPRLDADGRPASLLPCPVPAPDVAHRPQAHVLHGPGGECRASAAGAKEHESLARLEHGLRILALRVDPELQHASRSMERARNTAVTPELAHVSNVDQQHVLTAVMGNRRRSIPGLDLCIGLPAQFLDALRKLHTASRDSDSGRGFPSRCRGSPEPDHGCTADALNAWRHRRSGHRCRRLAACQESGRSVCMAKLCAHHSSIAEGYYGSGPVRDAGLDDLSWAAERQRGRQ